MDLSHTGQDIVGMAKYCDVLSPMIYPSHFFGMDGYAHPGDAPEHFIGESMDRFKLITKDSNATIRPWLQAFRWRTRTYSPRVHRDRRFACRRKGRSRVLVLECWERLLKPYAAMPVMKAGKAKYFRGDEMPGLAGVPATTAAVSRPRTQTF